MNITTKKSLLATMVALFASGATVQAVAQSDENRPARASRALDEIIVTAERREQNLQDVPVAISALSAETLDDRGITNTESLQYFVPNLSYGRSIQGSTNIAIRGIGNENTAVGGDAGVAIHLDGHYLQNSGFMTQDFFDVERVEVLRGPQGTLYGKNAVGGSVNIISKLPTEEFEGGLTLGVENYSARKFNGYLSGALANDLYGRIAAVDYTRDGYTKNITSGEDQDISNYTSVRGSLLWSPQDTVDVLVSAYRYKSKDDVALVIDAYPTVPLLAGFVPNPFLAADPYVLDPQRVRNDIDAEGYANVKGVSVDIDVDLSGIIFRSLSSYTDSNRFRKNDIDGSDQVYSFVSNDVDISHFSQELQLLSDNDSRVKWVTGLYYYKESSSNEILVDFFDVFGAPLPDTTFFDIDEDLETVSLGAFGQIDIPVSDKLELNLGMRYSKDKKDYISGFTAADFGLGGTLSTDKSWDAVTWKMGANYTLSDTSMLYASISTGYKAGGFSFSIESYDPESVTAYEIGIKSQLFDNDVRLNASIFYNDYTDKQEENRDPVTALSKWENAGEATLFGAEIEFLARPYGELQIDAMVSYLSATYGDFQTADPLHDELGIQDLDGNYLPRSPKYKFSVGVQYQWNLHASGSLSARASYKWQDEQYFRSFNTLQDFGESYGKSNASIWWLNPSEQLKVKLFVNNISNKNIVGNRTQNSTILGGTMNVTYEAPRVYGLSVSYQF